MPAGITTEEAPEVQPGEVKNPNTLAEKDEVRAMVASAAGDVGLPIASRASTTTAPEHAPATWVWGAVVNTSEAGGPVWMVSTWVASEKPAAVPVTVCPPGAVALSQKLAD